MNAPTLFVIAADLTKMQVVANIDESDVGRMRPGQVVSFRVDAFPTDTFIGAVQQVRLQPAVVQNVVIYSTVISVPNPQLKLKPGMTATVGIEIARRNNALRVPTAAVRFRPTEAMFPVLNQPVPPEVQRGAGGFAAAADAMVAVAVGAVVMAPAAKVDQAREPAHRKARRRLHRKGAARLPLRHHRPERPKRRLSLLPAAAVRSHPRPEAAAIAWQPRPAEPLAAAKVADAGSAAAAGEASTRT